MIKDRINLLISHLPLPVKKFISYFQAQSVVRKVFLLGSIVAASIFSLVLILFLLVFSGALGKLPNKNELLTIENPAASEVFSADSVLLGRYFIQERSNVRFDELPSSVVNAILATEDIRFYQHHGIDTRSLGRVLIKSLLFQSDASGGGSTLTQQLAKNLYPRKSYWFFSLPINKVREMIIASRLETVYSKNELITLYINTIPFGDNTFGLESASTRFFSVPVKNLEVDQAAVLIGMLKATYYYNPRIFPEQSLQRRNVVLSQMTKYKMLTQGKADSLKALPIKLNYKSITHHAGPAPYFREYIREELLEWCKQYNKDHGTDLNLYTSGLKIYTTLDSKLQQHAEDAMSAQMAITQKTFLSHWGKTDPWYAEPSMLEEAIKKSSHYRSLREQGKDDEEAMKIMKTPILMTLFTSEGDKEVTMSPVDSIRHYLKFLSAGVLAMNPSNGAIQIWVGGINHQYFQFDHVKESTRRQVGSTFKPIVYAAALEKGVKPCQFISAEKTTYTNMEGWAPQNSTENYDLKYSMPGALAYSVNTVSVQLLEKAGIANTIQLARKMGIKSHIEEVPSLALGTPDISVTEMVSAFTSFANDGKVVKPFYLTAITNHQNEVLEKYASSIPVQVMHAETAQMMLSMLRRAVEEGTSSSLRSIYHLSNDIGGKTGTTQSNADGWFIGVTPNLVIGCWVGGDDRRIRFRSTALGQGAKTALPIVGNFFQRVNSDKSLSKISQSRFPELSSSLERNVSCDLYKTDHHFLRGLFGKNNKEKKREFGAKKKGFFRRILGG